MVYSHEIYPVSCVKLDCAPPPSSQDASSKELSRILSNMLVSPFFKGNDISFIGLLANDLFTQ